MADVKKLVFSIMKFLEDQKVSSQLDEESLEGIEVALQCMSNAYGIDTADPDTVSKYQVQRNLLDIFNAQINEEPDSDFSSLSLHEPTDAEKALAEERKNQGNDFMKTEKYSDALECYTQALKLDNKNPVYYCNRAAAYSKLNKHNSTIEDCNKALSIDPQYSKAYGRMGIAYTSLEDHESALECYRKALELDPSNQTYQNNLEIAEQKCREAAAQTGFNFGPAGGMGMDLGALLNNPAMMNMARTFMQDERMQQMMTNMFQGQGAPGGDGGGMPGMPGMMPGGGTMADILQVGQQLAQQVQQTHPDLVAQLREQAQSGRTGNQSQDSNQEPPPPPPPSSQ